MAAQTFHGTTFHNHYPPREEPLSPPLSTHADENGGNSGDDHGFLVYRDVIASPSSPVRDGEHDATPRMITGPIDAGGHNGSRVILDARRRPEEPPRRILERSGVSGARTLETLRRIEAQDLEETRRKIETEQINRGEALRQAVLEVVRLQTQKGAIQAENLKMREALEKSKLTLEHHAFHEQRSRHMLQNAHAEIQQLQAMLSESNKLNAALMTKVQTLALRRDFQAPPSHMQQPFPAHLLQQQPPPQATGNTAAAMLAAATPRPPQAPQSQLHTQAEQQPFLMGQNPHLSTPLSLSSNFSRVAIETGMTDAERAEEAKMQIQLKEMMAAAIEEGRQAMAEEAEKKQAEEDATAAAAAAAETAEEAAANLKANNDAVEEAIRARREAEAKVNAVRQAMAAEHQAALNANTYSSAASTIESIAASGAAVLQGRQVAPPQQPSAGNGYEAAALAAQNGDYASALTHFSAQVQSRSS